MDDASIIVVDMLPSERTSFPTVALRSNPGGTKKKSKGGGLFSCLKGRQRHGCVRPGRYGCQEKKKGRATSAAG
eukprot:scaffold117750_cov21-Tisochrysis_lutea.AAC.3